MQRFYWRGELIEDIDAWCKEHDDVMIHFEARRKSPDINGTIYEETFTGKMPNTFWFSLCMGSGWTYKLLSTERFT